MSIFARWAEKLRVATADKGYTCDACGREVFDYPRRRLCDECEGKLHRIGDRHCQKCGRETVAEGTCLDCKASAPDFDKGFMPFSYRGESASMINRAKNGTPSLAWFFGEETARTFAARFDGEKSEPLLMIPVPMTAKAKKKRGYNQAERLAYAVCRELQKLGFTVTVDCDVLQKRRETAQQKQMSARERAENVQGAYHVHKRTACKDQRILLVDDIMTTGATASECAERLFGAGAANVYFLAATALPERK